MRILILNWRCPRHPKAGGAEVLTHQVARRLVAAGDQVEWFCGSFPGAQSEEDIDGVHIVRSGRQWTVHWKAFQRYRGRLRGRFDLVVDEINTMPFFTPLWADIPTLTLIFQLAREVWWYESRFPVSALGFIAERFYLMPYRNNSAVTISRSTEADLRRLGFLGNIAVMPIGTERGLSHCGKSSPPIYLYVGRLAPSKRLEDVIRAFALFRNAASTGELHIVGAGSTRYFHSLVRLVERLGVRQWVVFDGHLSKSDKHRLMCKAHVLLMASVREGWGMVVTEANAYGTPAVVYNVGGLRDSVRHGLTGLVVKPIPRAMADGMLQLWRNPLLYAHLAEEAKAWSACFTFDRSAETMRQEINRVIGSTGSLETAACR